MRTKARRIAIVAICAGLFFLDQLFKYIAHHSPERTWYILAHSVGWEHFANQGIAFSIPIPSFIVILVSPIIILFLIVLIVWKKQEKTQQECLALSLISFGAVSNLIDRILFQFTIDYIRVFTGFFNIADIMIVLGVLLFVIHKRRLSTP